MFVINYLLSAKFASYRSLAPAFVDLKAVGHSLSEMQKRSPIELSLQLLRFLLLSPPKTSSNFIQKNPKFAMVTVENSIISRD